MNRVESRRVGLLSRQAALMSLVASAAFLLCSCGGGDGDNGSGAVTIELSGEEAVAMINAGNVWILDVRTIEEFGTGHVRDATCADYNSSSFTMFVDAMDKGMTYVVYCGSGMRSSLATGEMEVLGFQHLYNVTGGLPSIRAAPGGAELIVDW